jgi:hypothetical protein
MDKYPRTSELIRVKAYVPRDPGRDGENADIPRAAAMSLVVLR